MASEINLFLINQPKWLCDSEDFWLDVKDVIKILTPLSEVITRIEGNEVNARRCYKKIREAFCLSKAAVEESVFVRFVKEELTGILNAREEFGKSDVAFLLDLLEPSDKGQALSNAEKQKGIKLRANKCLKNPLFAGREAEVLKEWALWLAGTGIFAKEKRSYAWDAVETMDALTWWKAWFSDTSLCQVVQMLNNGPISAAPTERNWSLRGRIHTKLRNRMKVDTASQVVSIKQNLQLEYAGLFEKERTSNAEEEEDGSGTEMEDC